MKKENLFYLVILLTVAVIRLYIFLFPSHLIIFGHIFHHFWIGIILLGMGLIINNKYQIKKLILGVGLGLIIDELVFIIIGGGSFNEYWSLPSIIGVVLLLFLLFFFRKRLT